MADEKKKNNAPKSSQTKEGAPTFDSTSYQNSMKTALTLSDLLEKYTTFKGKKDKNKAEMSDLIQNMLGVVNSHLGQEFGYKPSELKKYEEEGKQDELLQNLAGDLEDMVYDPKGPVQNKFVHKFPDYVSSEFKKSSSEASKIPGEIFYVANYLPMAKALEKSKIQLRADKIPSAIKKAVYADKNSTKESKNDVKTIIKEVVDSIVTKVYKPEDRESMETSAYFAKRSYERRFKFIKEHVIGDYFKLHLSEFGAYLENGAKALANINGNSGADSGKKRINAIKPYLEELMNVQQRYSRQSVAEA